MWTATRSDSSSCSPYAVAGYTWIQPTPKPTPGGRSRSESVSGIDAPSRATTIPFISTPSTNSSRIASPVGDATSTSWRCAWISSSDSTLKTARWPPESAGLSTEGNPTSLAARRVSAIDRTAA